MKNVFICLVLFSFLFSKEAFTNNKEFALNYLNETKINNETEMIRCSKRLENNIEKALKLNLFSSREEVISFTEKVLSSETSKNNSSTTTGGTVVKLTLSSILKTALTFLPLGKRLSKLGLDIINFKAFTNTPKPQAMPEHLHHQSRRY